MSVPPLQHLLPRANPIQLQLAPKPSSRLPAQAEHTDQVRCWYRPAPRNALEASTNQHQTHPPSFPLRPPIPARRMEPSNVSGITYLLVHYNGHTCLLLHFVGSNTLI
ncbi:hypothetical protein BC830DRAFT_441275 [Chytriomyces sp. MP71]|nr:hypothetical protein BC830DRAFT_441275 [Chytriomyces sp. MP71]